MTEPRGFDTNPIYAGLDLTSEFTYDSLGRMLTSTAPLVTRGVTGTQIITSSMTYNAQGQVTSVTDASGNLESARRLLLLSARQPRNFNQNRRDPLCLGDQRKAIQ